MRSLWRWVRFAALATVAAVAILLPQAWTSLGKRATGGRRARMERSPEWKGSSFDNPQPLSNDTWGWVKTLFQASPYVRPTAPVQVADVDPALFATPPTSGLRVTWFGHSSTLVEVDGKRFLTDPIWSDRASPIPWLGPQRFVAPPMALNRLPPIDGVLISHDHYDHLDRATIQAMRDWSGTRFFVPLGVGADLAYWGIPESRIVELDWWQHADVGDVQVVSTPSRHASGRGLDDMDVNLWTGFAILGPQHRVYYSGDTGLEPSMKRIGRELGPFDLTMIEVGQYNQTWPDWHMGPEQALVANQWVRGKVFLPVHWGLFRLAEHGWTEPVERAIAAAAATNQTLIAPRMGQSVEPSSPPALERWWPALPWTPGAQDPIVSTQLTGDGE